MRKKSKQKPQPKKVEKEDSSSSSSSSDEEEEEPTMTTTKFTDSNAKWLKPKKLADMLESSSSSNEGSDDDDSGSEDDDNESDKDIEEETRLLDAAAATEKLEAAEEMDRTIREQTAVYHLPTEEEMEEDVDRVVPPSETRSHIESILEVLAEFKARREPGRSRKEYIDQLGRYIAELYGYLPELVEYFLTMFSPAETLEFVDASDKPRPLVIRTNTLKTRRKDLAAALIKRGVSLDPLSTWSKVGLKIAASPVPIGATPEYLNGMYMLQSAASMCPILALDPQPSELILDMSAAPGGKTSYIAQLMRNTGVIIANDLRPDRQKATIANLHRLGVNNTVTCAKDGRKLPSTFAKNRFDRVLLDAPCSGLGVISRDPSVKVQRTIADVQKCAHLQKELLLAAIDSLKYKNPKSSVMVYSTCSVSVFENEEVVQYALEKRDIQIIDSGLEFGKPGFTRYQHKRFHPSMALARRFYPHTVNMDGFFVCKIRKLSDTTRQSTKEVDADAVEEVTGASKETERKTTNDKTEVVAAAVDKKDKRKSRVAMPPPKPAKKKQKLNAKVTKPRRMKSIAKQT